jgi:hypothetical protein
VSGDDRLRVASGFVIPILPGIATRLFVGVLVLDSTLVRAVGAGLAGAVHVPVGAPVGTVRVAATLARTIRIYLAGTIGILATLARNFPWICH